MDGDNKKNLVLAIALSAVVMIGWQFFFAIPEQEARIAAEQQRAAQQAQSGAGESAQPSLGAEVPKEIQSIAGFPKARFEVLEASPRLEIKTDRLSGSLSLKGARIDDLTLLNYRETVDDDSANIVLLNPAGTQNPYHAEFGWLGQKDDVPNRNTVWSADKSVLTPNDPVTLSWTNDKGVRFEQVITLDENFHVLGHPARGERGQ